MCLLIRRNRTTGELAFYRCWSPRPVHLRALVAVAGIRWSIETAFQTGKGPGRAGHGYARLMVSSPTSLPTPSWP